MSVLPLVLCTLSAVPVQPKPTPIDVPDVTKPLFQRPLNQDVNDVSGAKDHGVEAAAWLKKAKAAKIARAFLPGFRPLVSGDLVVYRNYNRLVAVYAKRKVFAEDNEVFKPGELFWASTDFEGAIARILSDAATVRTVQQWLQLYAASNIRACLCESTLTRTMTTDGKCCFVVDDLPLIPPPAAWLAGRPGVPALPRVPQRLNRLVQTNSLYAFELESGRIIWRRGREDNVRADPDFAASHFLGPPLFYQGKLYALNEPKTKKICLVCLDPKNGKLRWSVPLANVAKDDRFAGNPMRRFHSASPVPAGSLMLCPTHGGKLVAVDTVKMAVAWSFTIPKEKFRLGQVIGRWHRASVHVAGDGVVVTSPRSSLIWCVNLRSGKEKWKFRASTDLAIVSASKSQLLVLSRYGIRAVNATNGKELWHNKLGSPSGVGAMRNGAYYLALSMGKGKRPGIAVINPRNGKLLRSIKLPPNSPMLGNLAFSGNVLIAQNATTITAFRMIRSEKQQ